MNMISFNLRQDLRCRPAVRISGFHPGDPGSIPGNGIFYISPLLNVKYDLGPYFSQIRNAAHRIWAIRLNIITKKQSLRPILSMLL